MSKQVESLNQEMEDMNAPDYLNSIIQKVPIPNDVDTTTTHSNENIQAQSDIQRRISLISPSITKDYLNHFDDSSSEDDEKNIVYLPNNENPVTSSQNRQVTHSQNRQKLIVEVSNPKEDILTTCTKGFNIITTAIKGFDILISDVRDLKLHPTYSNFEKLAWNMGEFLASMLGFSTIPMLYYAIITAVTVHNTKRLQEYVTSLAVSTSYAIPTLIKHTNSWYAKAFLVTWALIRMCKTGYSFFKTMQETNFVDISNQEKLESNQDYLNLYSNIKYLIGDIESENDSLYFLPNILVEHVDGSIAIYKEKIDFLKIVTQISCDAVSGDDCSILKDDTLNVVELGDFKFEN